MPLSVAHQSASRSLSPTTSSSPSILQWHRSACLSSYPIHSAAAARCSMRGCLAQPCPHPIEQKAARDSSPAAAFRHLYHHSVVHARADNVRRGAAGQSWGSASMLRRTGRFMQRVGAVSRIVRLCFCSRWSRPFSSLGQFSGLIWPGKTDQFLFFFLCSFRHVLKLKPTLSLSNRGVHALIG